MKTFLISSTFITLLMAAIIATSCKKETIEPTLAENLTNTTSKAAPGWGLNNTLYKIGDIVFCHPPAENCFDEVIVKPERVNFGEKMRGIYPESLREFFVSGEYIQYFPGLSSENNREILKNLTSRLYESKVISIKDKDFIMLYDKENLSKEPTYVFQVVYKK